MIRADHLGLCAATVGSASFAIRRNQGGERGRMQDLAGKVAFVTGGANGIGFGMARAFLAEGMKVVIADWSADHIEKAKTLLKGSGTRLFALSGGIALMIALATVSIHAVKAAVANPVESLRYE